MNSSPSDTSGNNRVEIIDGQGVLEGKTKFSCLDTIRSWS